MSRGERRFRLVLLVLEFGVIGSLLIWTMTVWHRVPGYVALGSRDHRTGLSIMPSWLLLAQLGVALVLITWTIWQTIRGPRLDLVIAGLALALFFALTATAPIMAAVYGTGQLASGLLLGSFLVGLGLLVWISQRVAPDG